MIAATRMLLVPVKLRIIRNCYRFKAQRGVVLNTDDDRRDIDQCLQKPIVITIDINREKADLRKAMSDEVEIVQGQEFMDDLNACWPERAGILDLPLISVNQESRPFWVCCEFDTVELNGVKTELDEGTRCALRQI